jgi:D-threo-aldose 1-dehydrogenase
MTPCCPCATRASWVNEWEVCQTLAERGDFDLFLLAGRYSLLEQEALESFLPLCEERGIGMVVGGPYNSGILAGGPKPGAFYNYAPAPPAIIEKVKRIESVCDAQRVALSAVALSAAALQFPLLNRNVVSVIPGGQAVAEVRANRANLEVEIPSELWAALKAEGLMRADAPTP